MICFNKNQDKIAVIAPSSSNQDAIHILSQAVSILEKQGFNVLIYDNIFADNELKFHAAPKINRLMNLQNAMRDDDVKIIWAYRGGYGATEIVFDSMNIEMTIPKLIIGFSDITAIHTLFNMHYKLPSLHASMLCCVEDNQDALIKVIEFLHKKHVKYKISPYNKAAKNTSKQIEAELIGGNLTVLCNLLGTKLQPYSNNKILILEDVNERGYQIHRHLVHLRNAELFNNLQAVILGEFTKGDDLSDNALKSFFDNYVADIPCYRLQNFGHVKINNPITLGRNVIINENKLLVTNPLQFK